MRYSQRPYEDREPTPEEQGKDPCLTAKEHGRVHGITIDDTFYVIWLDHDHRLYPDKRD